jgi:BirA family biotin operon repressor/biotin-[acetyl-CoA-carboxylase] ligase
MVRTFSEDYLRLDVYNPFGGPVYHISSTGSTMEDAGRLITRAAGAEESSPLGDPVPGTVLSAGVQTRGVGRIEGRVWQSPPGKSLLISLLLPEGAVRFPATLLPLAAALGLARFVETGFALRPKIKWPNDLVIADRKCAGILCRRTRGWLITGIGLNVRQRTFPDVGAGSAGGGPTSLAGELDGKVPPPLELLPDLLVSLQEAFDSEGIAEAVEDLLWHRGEEYTVALGDPEAGEAVTGKAEGIGAGGALLLRVDGKRRAVYSGEVTLK